MLPRRFIGDIKPENWLGFVDAIYAIILTLLLIELPTLLLDLIKEYEHHPSFRTIMLQSFALSFFGYLSIFIIVYDIWAHHRMLVVEACKSRINSAILTFVLFLCSLLPPFYYIVSRLRHDFLLGLTHFVGLQSKIYEDVRFLLFLILFCIYGCIALVATKDLRDMRRRGETRASLIALERLKDSSFVMLPIIILISVFAIADRLIPPIPLMLIALSTYLPIDSLMIKLQRLIFPQRLK